MDYFLNHGLCYYVDSTSYQPVILRSQLHYFLNYLLYFTCYQLVTLKSRFILVSFIIDLLLPCYLEITVYIILFVIHLFSTDSMLPRPAACDDFSDNPSTLWAVIRCLMADYFKNWHSLLKQTFLTFLYYTLQQNYSLNLLIHKRSYKLSFLL